MKTIAILTLFLALISCGSESKKSDPEPVYTSLVGNWKFKGKDISGNFEIATFSGTIAVNDANGTYTNEGVTNKISKKATVLIDGFKIRQLSLSGEGTNYIDFYESGEYSSDFKTMTFKSHSKAPQGIFVVETVTIERVN